VSTARPLRINPTARNLIAERPFLFWSKGPDGFYDLARAGVAGNALQRPVVGRVPAYADYDGRQRPGRDHHHKPRRTDAAP